MLTDAFGPLNPINQDDDFAHFARELAKQRLGKVTITATPTVIKGNQIGVQTAAAILNMSALDADKRHAESFHGGCINPNASQVGGTHYIKLAIQPFDYAMANNLDALQFTVIKYVTRFRDKGGIQDLNKAVDTLHKLIRYEQSQGRK